ncbi:MAG: tetratricopeptide repeat protein [Phycisphaeraceae bacterium]|nr:tetratricopeptide repeat protein [Phycisphaeraceae bacterium]
MSVRRGGPFVSVPAWVLALCCGLVACAGAPRGTGPYSPASQAQRDPLEAQRLSRDASAVMVEDPHRAEEMLREALSADLYCGPAHNNLGVLYLQRGMLYEAAGEFEWARRLMPGHPDPRLNLGLALERAGRVDEALAEYAAALEVHPDHLPSLQALARCQLRHGRTDATTDHALREIAFRGETRQWREWARMRIAQEP